MRQAIITRYIGPTNVRGSRVKATAEAGTLTLGWDNSVSAEENHEAAARALIAKLCWMGKHYPGQWVGGALPQKCKDSYTFVYSEK